MNRITNEDIKILGRLVNISTEGVVADASQVYDSTQRKNQEVINSEMKNKTKDATTTTYGIVRLASGKNDLDDRDVPTIKILRDAIQDAIDGILEDPNHTLQDQLNSIRELANAINNDASFYTTIQNWLAQKADKSAFDTLKGRVDDLAERVAYLEECCEQVHQYMDEFSITWSGAGSSHVRISPAVLRAGTNTAVCTIDNGWHCSTPLTRSNVLGDYDTITQTGTDTNIQLVFTGVRSNIVINAPVTKTFFNITKHVVGADSTDTYPFEVVYSGTHANAQTIAAGTALNLTVTGKKDRDVFDEDVPVSITIGNEAYTYNWQDHVNNRITWLNGDPHSITIQIPASDIDGDIELFFNGWHESSSRIILKISPNPNVGSTPGWSFGDILDHDSNEKHDGINNDEPWYFLNYLWSDDWIQLEKTSALATALNNDDTSVYRLKVEDPSAVLTYGVYTITPSGNNGVNTSAIRNIFRLRVTPSGKDGSFSLNGNPQLATKDNTDYTLTVQTEPVPAAQPSYGTVTISPDHGTASRSTFSADGTSHTITITPASGYTTTGMNATSNNNNVSASVSGNKITVTGTSSNNATITVTLPAEGTPTPSGPATISIEYIDDSTGQVYTDGANTKSFTDSKNIGESFFMYIHEGSGRYWVPFGYNVSSVSVVMNGTDVTNDVYDGSTQTISISSVTGNTDITIHMNKLLSVASTDKAKFDAFGRVYSGYGQLNTDPYNYGTTTQSIKIAELSDFDGLVGATDSQKLEDLKSKTSIVIGGNAGRSVYDSYSNTMNITVNSSAPFHAGQLYLSGQDVMVDVTCDPTNFTSGSVTTDTPTGDNITQSQSYSTEFANDINEFSNGGWANLLFVIDSTTQKGYYSTLIRGIYQLVGASGSGVSGGVHWLYVDPANRHIVPLTAFEEIQVTCDNPSAVISTTYSGSNSDV